MKKFLELLDVYIAGKSISHHWLYELKKEDREEIFTYCEAKTWGDVVRKIKKTGDSIKQQVK